MPILGAATDTEGTVAIVGGTVAAGLLAYWLLEYYVARCPRCGQPVTSCPPCPDEAHLCNNYLVS